MQRVTQSQAYVQNAPLQWLHPNACSVAVRFTQSAISLICYAKVRNWTQQLPAGAANLRTTCESNVFGCNVEYWEKTSCTPACHCLASHTAVSIFKWRLEVFVISRKRMPTDAFAMLYSRFALQKFAYTVLYRRIYKQEVFTEHAR